MTKNIESLYWNEMTKEVKKQYFCTDNVAFLDNISEWLTK